MESHSMPPVSFYQKADVSGLNPPWTQRLSNCKSFGHPRSETSMISWYIDVYCIWSIGVSHNDAWYPKYWLVQRCNPLISIEGWWGRIPAFSLKPLGERMNMLAEASCTALKPGSLNGRCHLLKGIPNSCLVWENSGWILVVFVWKESFMLL